MNKRQILTVLLAIMAGTLVFANGAQESESNENDFEPGNGRPTTDGPQAGPRAFFSDEELLSLTGTLDVSNDFPRIKTEDKTCILMIPAVLPEGFTVKNGQEITVEGYIINAEDGMGLYVCNNKNEDFLTVIKAVVDGKEYEFLRTQMADRNDEMKKGPKDGGPPGGGRPPQRPF